MDRFVYLCTKLLELYGNDLYTSSRNNSPRLASLRTPVGIVFVKTNENGFYVSCPSMLANRPIYHRLAENGFVTEFHSGRADRLSPFLEKKLVLDLLAGI